MRAGECFAEHRWSRDYRSNGEHYFRRICLVDSTRSGKSMPDSFSKTVPIWCCVVNRALMMRGLAQSHDWDTQLYTPPQCVSKQEHAQIENKLSTWAESLSVRKETITELPNINLAFY